MINEKDRPKLIGLIAAIVLVLVFAIYRIKTVNGPSTVTPAVATNGSGQTGDTVGSGPTTPGAENQKDEDIKVPTMLASSTADPFRQVAPLSPPSGNSAVPNRGNPIPPVNPNLGPSPLTGTITPLPVPNIAQPIVEPVLVTGVIPGNPAVAIISVGKETYVVRKGQVFDGGYVVISVDSSGVALRKGGVTHRFPVGKG